MLIKSFLSSSRVRRALATRPGEAGFSLIELVVVIAILGILIAIALPNFLNVQKDAKINQAKNALAGMVKECAVKETRTNNDTIGTNDGTGASAVVQSAKAKLNGYKLTDSSDPATAGTAFDFTTEPPVTSCYTSTAESSDGKLPNFTIAYVNGETTKTCHGASTAEYLEGCVDANGDVVADNGTEGTW